MSDTKISDYTIAGALALDELIDITYDPTGTPLTRSLSLFRIRGLTIQNEAVIASANVNLNLPSSPAIGDKFFCRWSGGDGSNQAILVASGSHTVEHGGTVWDTTAKARCGQGTGILEAEYVLLNVWEVVSYSDSDGGLFTGTFTKNESGLLLMSRTISESLDVNSASVGLFRSNSTAANLPLERISSSLDELTISANTTAAPICMLDAANATTYNYRYFRGDSDTTVSVSNTMHAVSRWA